MKIKIAIVTFASFLFSTCTKDVGIKSNSTPPKVDCSKSVTITQGLSGSCVFRYGDWMPGPDNSCCNSSTAKRTIYFYAPTTNSTAVQIGGPNSSFFSQVNTTLIAQTQCDDNGCYQISLPPGQYSVFILEDGKYYARGMSGNFVLCPATVDSGSVRKLDLIIDYQAVY